MNLGWNYCRIPVLNILFVFDVQGPRQCAILCQQNPFGWQYPPAKKTAYFLNMKYVGRWFLKYLLFRRTFVHFVGGIWLYNQDSGDVWVTCKDESINISQESTIISHKDESIKTSHKSINLGDIINNYISKCPRRKAAESNEPLVPFCQASLPRGRNLQLLRQAEWNDAMKRVTARAQTVV